VISRAAQRKGARVPDRGPAPVPATAHRMPSGQALVLALQRSAGNRAVARLLRQPATALDARDAATRQGLQVATATVGADFVDLNDTFGPEAGRTLLPTDLRSVFGPGVPKQLETGLTSVAAQLVDDAAKITGQGAAMAFRANTTMQVALNLNKHGGVDGVWRFTRLARVPPAKGQEILIEFLGAAAPAATAAGAKAREDRLTALGFTINSGFAPDERAGILEAVSLVPDAALSRLKRLAFSRSRSTPRRPGETAHYDPNTHTILVYDDAFPASALRHKVSTGFTTQGVRSIVHELGHAVDYTPRRLGLAQSKPVVEATESGRYIDVTKPDVKGAYAQAVAKDGGKAVTAYGQTDLIEGYAEAFSLYFSDPQLLKLLRPNVFAYFQGQFNAPTAATPTQPAAAPPPKPPVKPPTKELARAARLRRAPETAVVDLTATDDDFRRHIAADDWAGVAGVLQRYDAHRVRRERALWLDVWQLRKLALYLRPGGPGGKQPSPLLPLVENLLAVKLDATYFPVVAGASWSTVVHLLATYDEALVLDRAREIPRRHGAGILETVRRIAILTLGDAHHVPRALAFLGLEGQTGASARPTKPGAMNERKPVGPAVDVPGGKVTTHDDVQDAHRQGGWTGLVYEGADAPNTGWLQFACRDAEGLDARGDHLGWVTGISAPIAGQPGRIHWEKPENARWHVDAKSTEVPFYESKNAEGRSSGQHITGPTTTAIYDLPDPGLPAARAGFAKKPRAAKVVERVRLHSYLVRGMEVLYENSMVVEFTYFGPSDAPQRQNLAGTGGVVGSLLPVHHEALLSRFPAWTFYARR